MQKIAIIMPCFYSNNIVRRALDHIKMQTKKENIVLYMVNDCSPNTDCEYQDLIEEYSPFFCIQYFKTEKNSGPGVARQLVLNNINDEYIMFHDDDDWLYDEYVIENYIDAIKKNSDAVLFMGRQCDLVEGNGKSSMIENPLLNGNIIRKDFIDKYSINFVTSLSYWSEDALFYYEMKYYQEANDLKEIKLNNITYIRYHSDQFPTLTVKKFSSEIEEQNSFSAFIFNDLEKFYSIIVFYKKQDKLLYKHKEYICRILRSVFEETDLFLEIFNLYGFGTFSYDEIIVFKEHWQFLLNIVKENEKIITNWQHSFYDRERFGELSKLYKEVPFNELYENFSDRYDTIIKKYFDKEKIQ